MSRNGIQATMLAAVAAIVWTGLFAGWLYAQNGTRYGKPGAGKEPQSVSHPDFVGAAACGGCHQAELKAWTGSHHDLAMQTANPANVLGDFSGITFEHQGVASTFFKKGDKFFVRTDGPDGKLEDFEIVHTFGVTPLQQYLIAFPGGRLQALSIAWDSRPKAEGGQRWFHLYPNEKIEASDPLHWTGIYQNWNMQCAECHSTNLRKNYDPATNSYSTNFTEINVACESCHGPGRKHVEWAQSAKAPFSPDDAKGLTIQLQSRRNEAWRFPSAEAPFAVRDKPAPMSVMNICAACHARRSTIFEEAPTGRALENTHVPSLLTLPNYHADGQQREEVYVWGSFLQSKMFQRGVTCVDCLEPHSLKLRADDNRLCLSCHNAQTFDTEKHHFHKTGSVGAQCVSCHMPETNYMVVDGRRDHAFRVPRPDISAIIGSHDACTTCHAGRDNAWAMEAMDRWYGKDWRERPTDALTIHAGAHQGAKALAGLMEIAADDNRPAILRATALRLAQPHMRREAFAALPALLADPDPRVRMEALALSERLAPQSRAPVAGGLLQDEIRGVRRDAARVLADVPASAIAEPLRKPQEQALREYAASLDLNADWPGENVNCGNFLWRQQRVAEARSAFERAIALDPRFAAGYANLADLERQQRNEQRAEAILRQGVTIMPTDAGLRHALGLALVRKSGSAAALAQIRELAVLAPDNARYAYVYAVGLKFRRTPSRGDQVARGFQRTATEQR